MKIQIKILLAVSLAAIPLYSFAYEDPDTQTCSPDEDLVEGGSCEREEIKYSAPGCDYLRLDGIGRFNPNTLETDPAAATMALIPPADQGDLGVCYSFAAAQLIDAWRLSHGESLSMKRVSPIVAALDHGLHFRPEEPLGAILRAYTLADIEGGTERNIVNFVRERGFCDERLVLGYGSGVRYDDIAKVLQKRFGEYVLWKINHFGGAPSLLIPGLHDVDDPMHQKPFAEEVRRDLRNLGMRQADLPPLALTAKMMSGFNPANYVRNMLAWRCRDQRTGVRIPPARKFGDSDTSYNVYREKIEKLLERPQPQPMAVGFCSRLLKSGKNYYGIRRDDCGPHAGVIVGRRYNPDQDRCEYLLQSSWGSRCDFYHSDWECENGKVWVDRDQLTVNMSNLTYLAD